MDLSSMPAFLLFSFLLLCEYHIDTILFLHRNAQFLEKNLNITMNIISDLCYILDSEISNIARLRHLGNQMPFCLYV